MVQENTAITTDLYHITQKFWDKFEGIRYSNGKGQWKYCSVNAIYPLPLHKYETRLTSNYSTA